MKLSDIKKLKVGDTLTMTYSLYQPNKLVGVPRKIIKMQSNAMKFEGGSWLYFPKASEIVSEGEKSFSVLTEVENKIYKTLTYKLDEV